MFSTFSSLSLFELLACRADMRGVFSSCTVLLIPWHWWRSRRRFRRSAMVVGVAVIAIIWFFFSLGCVAAQSEWRRRLRFAEHVVAYHERNHRTTTMWPGKNVLLLWRWLLLFLYIYMCFSLYILLLLSRYRYISSIHIALVHTPQSTPCMYTT